MFDFLFFFFFQAEDGIRDKLVTGVQTSALPISQQGQGIFAEIARNLEGSVLEPLVEMMGSLVAQYHDDFSSPQVREILGDDLANELSLLSWEDRKSVV